jgi:hypothetical protein
VPARDFRSAVQDETIPFVPTMRSERPHSHAKHHFHRNTIRKKVERQDERVEQASVLRGVEEESQEPKGVYQFSDRMQVVWPAV